MLSYVVYDYHILLNELNEHMWLNSDLILLCEVIFKGQTRINQFSDVNNGNFIGFDLISLQWTTVWWTFVSTFWKRIVLFLILYAGFMWLVTSSLIGLGCRQKYKETERRAHSTIESWRGIQWYCQGNICIPFNWG